MPHPMLLLVQLHLSWPLRRPTYVASKGNGPDLKQPGPLRQDGSSGESGSGPSGTAHSCKTSCRIDSSSNCQPNFEARLTGLRHVRYHQPMQHPDMKVSDSEDKPTAMGC